MQILSHEDLESVHGGGIPVVVAVASAAYSFMSHFAVRSLGNYIASRAATAYAIYSAAEAAEAAGGGGGGNRAPNDTVGKKKKD